MNFSIASVCICVCVQVCVYCGYLVYLSVSLAYYILICHPFPSFVIKYSH